MTPMQVFGLDRKVAIVWGGGAGIGMATAHRLAEAGCRLVVVDRDAAAAARVAAELAAADAIAVAADVTRADEVESVVQRAQAAFGVVDLSASVVGVAQFRPLVQMSAEEWEQQLALNLRPAFLIGQAVARAMIAQGTAGAIAFVSSISGLQAAALHAAYGAAKSGMTGLVQSMATEWGPHGIRVNALAPGPIATARITASETMEALLARRLPLGRMGRVEEVANGMLFLLSDLASFVTGQTLVADGGWMAAPLIRPDDVAKDVAAR